MQVIAKKYVLKRALFFFTSWALSKNSEMLPEVPDQQVVALERLKECKQLVAGMPSCQRVPAGQEDVAKGWPDQAPQATQAIPRQYQEESKRLLSARIGCCAKRLQVCTKLFHLPLEDWLLPQENAAAQSCIRRLYLAVSRRAPPPWVATISKDKSVRLK